MRTSTTDVMMGGDGLYLMFGEVPVMKKPCILLSLLPSATHQRMG